jgi:hypothetical protein
MAAKKKQKTGLNREPGYPVSDTGWAYNSGGKKEEKGSKRLTTAVTKKKEELLLVRLNQPNTRLSYCDSSIKVLITMRWSNLRPLSARCARSALSTSSYST